jgi:hypothetical protein
MNIVTPSAGSKTITIIPRKYPASVTAKLTNENTNTTEVKTITPVNSNGFMSLVSTWTLTNDNFYLLEVFDGTLLIYRGRVFCTNQTNLPKYSVNYNLYTEANLTDNSFIVI